MKTISVVIPNFNGKELLKHTLPALFKAIAYRNIDAEVIVVDDASTDSSTHFLKTNYPQIIVLENKENIGFGESSNKGFRVATKDLILCLNSDMQIREDFFTKQLFLFDDPTVFSSMSRIMNADKDVVLESCKGVKFNKCYFKIRNIHDNKYETTTHPTLFACGGNAIYNRIMLLQLGGFSDIYTHFYFEDVDLGLRAWRKGWKSIYTKETEVYHNKSATINATYSSLFKKKTYYLNNLKLWYVHASEIQRKKIRRQAFYQYLIWSILSPLNYQFKAKKHAYKMGMQFDKYEKLHQPDEFEIPTINVLKKLCISQ